MSSPVCVIVYNRVIMILVYIKIYKETRNNLKLRT